MGKPGDDNRREQNEAESEGKDRAYVIAKIAPRCKKPGRIKQRRQEQYENKFRIEMEMRQAGDESQDQPADDEEDGVRDLEFARDNGQSGDCEQQPENQFDRRGHSIRVGNFPETARVKRTRSNNQHRRTNGSLTPGFLLTDNSNMDVTLPVQLEEFIRRKIADGEFQSADAVVSEGLRLLQRQEAWKIEARGKIDEGWNQANAGQLSCPEQARERLSKHKEDWKATRDR